MEDNGVNQGAEGENGPPPDIIPQNEVVDGVVVSNNSEHQMGNGEIPHAPMLQHRQGSKDSTQEEEGLFCYLNCKFFSFKIKEIYFLR